ncbi:MAG TPA: hypothetical protein P5077_00430 [bacterium]|nr:hypothetical protein [bacterium]
MSNKLETLKQESEKQQSLPKFIEYLDQAHKENEYDRILAETDAWRGEQTPEIDFFRGAALLALGRPAEAIEQFKAVLAVNPNHFRARKKIEEAGSPEGVAPTATTTASASKTRYVRLPEFSTEDNEHYRRAGQRNLMILALGALAVILTLWALWGGGTSGVDKMLKDPEATLWPLSVADFERRSDEMRAVERRFPNEDAPRKALFYLTAFALLDYHLSDHKDILSQVRFYYTLSTQKDPSMEQILRYIEGDPATSPLIREHALDSAVPENAADLAAFTPRLQGPVTRSNLRTAWYDALLLYRAARYDESLRIAEAMLTEFPALELPQKLRVAAIARKAVKQDAIADSTRALSDEQVRQLTGTLARWRGESEERHLLSEAYVALGAAAHDPLLEREGFYLGCPGRPFCADILNRFMNGGRTEDAKRMALYVREKKGTARNADDLKLVMLSSYRNGDHSNCFFAFKEIQQFFPAVAQDNEVLRTAAICCEKENYLEEALALYEKIAATPRTPEQAAKIAEIRYLLSRDAQSAQELKALAEKYPDSATILNAHLSVLLRTDNRPEIQRALDRLYSLTGPDGRLAVIQRYLQAGLTMRAVQLLTENRDRRDINERLYDLYNSYFLFSDADAVAGKGTFDSTPFWNELREHYAALSPETAEVIGEKLEKLAPPPSQRCVPALLYLKAEAFRQSGDKPRTFSMIDGVLECDRTYLPGLILAAEMAFYQGDRARALKGVKYLIEQAPFLSPGKLIYHNYLVLLLAELYISSGNEKKGLTVLTQELSPSHPFGKREREKLQDIYDKSKLVLKKRIEQLVAERFR